MMFISLLVSDCNEMKQLYRPAQIFLRPNFLHRCIIYDPACWLQKVTQLAHHKQVIHHSEYCGINLLFHISQFAINISSFSPTFVSNKKVKRYTGIQLRMNVFICTGVYSVTKEWALIVCAQCDINVSSQCLFIYLNSNHVAKLFRFTQCYRLLLRCLRCGLLLKAMDEFVRISILNLICSHASPISIWTDTVRSRCREFCCHSLSLSFSGLLHFSLSLFTLSFFFISYSLSPCLECSGKIV